MRIVNTSYINTPEYNDPYAWLDRISFHTGVLEELARQHDVDSVEQINYSGRFKRNGVNYHFLNFEKGKLYFPRQLHRYISKLEPDVVWVNGLIFPLQVIQLRRMLKKKSKIIVQHHAEKPFTGVRKILQRIADRHINHYFFTSKEIGAEWLKNGIIGHERKIAGVMEVSSFFGVLLKETALIRTKVTGDPVYLWVGRLNANKDPLTVLKGFKKYIKYHPSAKLYMIYHTGELMNEITSFCQKEGDLQKAIEMVGKVSHEEMQYWYNSADFLISGSHEEGSGVAVCEAMSCGCIPVLTSIPSFRKMTGPGKCGLLYEAGNEEDLLLALLKTHDLDVAKEKARTLQQFAEELSFKAIAKEVSKVIDSL